MNQDVFEKLQYNQMKEIVEDYCISTPGKERIRNLMPSGQIKVVANRLEETTEGRKLLDITGTVPLQGMTHIGEIIEKVEKDIILNEEQLTHVALFLRGCRKIQTYMVDKEIEAPTLRGYSRALEGFAFIEEEIEVAIRNNRIADEASTALKKIRRHLYLTEAKIEEKLNQFLKHPSNKPYIQEFFVAKRQGKLTIPIKASYKSKINGIVVESTDKTAFMEIGTVSKYSGELLNLQIEESTEEYKILTQLTGLVYDNLESIKRNVEVMVQYDVIFAKARYSKLLNGRSPQLNDYGMIRINQGRHPLLEGKVVPLQFNIGEKYRSLVITGPNAGGKTIVLKTVGLLTLAMQSGFHIPVGEGTQMSVFDRVYVDIGDGQSIENALSTFSSHVKNLAEIVKNTNKSTLLLFDEIGSGTEPGEGAALAIAILEALYQRGAITVATTHYNEIKDFSAGHPDFENAAMQFNAETLEPLYKLQIGKSGESNALFIAKRMGITEDILTNAKKYMQEKTYDYTKISERKVRVQKVEEVIEENKQTYEKGDRVVLLEYNEEAIVYAPKTQYEPLKVFYKDDIIDIDDRRVKLKLAAKELYPEGYDMEALFVGFKERKLERDIERGSKKALKKIEKERRQERQKQ